MKIVSLVGEFIGTFVRDLHLGQVIMKPETTLLMASDWLQWEQEKLIFIYWGKFHEFLLESRGYFWRSLPVLVYF